MFPKLQNVDKLMSKQLQPSIFSSLLSSGGPGNEDMFGAEPEDNEDTPFATTSGLFSSSMAGAGGGGLFDDEGGTEVSEALAVVLEVH